MNPNLGLLIVIIGAAVQGGTSQLPNTRPIVAYSCDNVEFQRKMFIGDVLPCVQPNTTSGNSTAIYGAIIRTVTHDVISVVSCRVKVLTSICRCGMHSHCASPINGVTEDYFEMSRDDCIRSHRERRWTYGEFDFRDLVVNSTVRVAHTSKGTKAADGSCTGASFTFRGTSYDHSSLEQDFHISLYSYTAKLSVRTNEVILPGGVVCDFQNLGCQDEVTSYYWLPKDGGHDCLKDKFQSIVEGSIEVVHMPSIHGKDDIQYAVVEIDSYVFALKLVSKFSICQYHGYMTEHNNLFFVELPGLYNPFQKAAAADVDMALYVNSKLLFFEIANTKSLLTLRQK